MSQDNPQNPFNVSLTPGSQPQNKSIARGGEVFAMKTHGDFYTGSYYNRCFAFNVTAVTVPKIASGLVSVFSLYNPPTSTVNLELVDFDAGLTTATTVVDTIGLYWSTPTLAALGTLTTIGVLNTNWFNCNLGGIAGQGNPYSAYTHSGTPVRIDILMQFGAVTSTNDIPIHKDFNGKIILPPGHVVSVGASTAAGPAGQDLQLRWQEVNTL